jgi:hypothetical protein
LQLYIFLIAAAVIIGGGGGEVQILSTLEMHFFNSVIILTLHLLHRLEIKPMTT